MQIPLTFAEQYAIRAARAEFVRVLSQIARDKGIKGMVDIDPSDSFFVVPDTPEDGDSPPQ